MPDAAPARSPLSRVARALAIAAPLALLGWVLSSRGLRLVLWGFLGFGWQLVRGLALFATTDPRGVAASALTLLLKVALMLAPAALALVRVRPARRLWFAPVAVLSVLVLPFAVVGVSTAPLWAALLTVALASLWLVRRPAFRAAFLLPFLFALVPLLEHSPLSDLYWTRERLAQRCAAHPGLRPDGGAPALYSARNYAVTPSGPDRLLVTGERGVFELRREPSGAMHVLRRLPFTGNLWEGCRRGDGVWLVHLPTLFFVPDAPSIDARTGRAEEVLRVPLPDTYMHERETDYLDVVCPRADGPLFVTGFLYDGLARYEPESRALRWYSMGGSYPQAVLRSDGRLLISVLNELLVFDPEAGRILSRSLAGGANVGHDVCALDGSAVTADALGRVRYFAREPNEHYRFVRGRSMPTPRRIAFSPDCTRIAVASANDRDLWLLRTADLSLEREFVLGPSLRDVRFLDATHLAAVDACSVNVLDVGAGR